MFYKNLARKIDNLEARERRGLTDKITDIECLVIGPESIVIARVPATVGTNNVVGSGDRREDSNGGDKGQ